MLTSVQIVSKTDWKEISREPIVLLGALQAETVFVVKHYFATDLCDQIRSDCQTFAKREGAKWFPLLNECPDYYRIHDNYPNAYAQSVQNGWYFHTWNKNFARVLALPGIFELFEIKRRLGGLADNSFLTN